MGLVESLPVQRVRPVLFLPLWLGTLRDAVSGAAASGAGAGPYWCTRGTQDGACFGGTGALQFPNSATMEALTGGTVFWWGSHELLGAVQRTFSKRDVGGTQIEFYISATNMIIGDGAVTRSAAANPVGATSYAATVISGDTPVLYRNGVFSADFSGTVNITANDADLFLGNVFSGPSPMRGHMSGVLWYDGILTPAEIASLHDWSQSRITPRKQWPGGGLDIPTLTGTANEPKFLDNISSARVTLADETSGKLSNTPYTIESGTWKLAEDATTGERYIECVVAGRISRRNAEAYGTWEFKFSKSATSTFLLSFISAEPDASGAGYRFDLLSDEQMRLFELLIGAIARSSIGYTEDDATYTVRITRSAANEFTVYVRGGNIGGAFVLMDSSVSGTNPIIDGTTTESKYWTLDTDAGDRLYLDRQYAGVVVP